MLRYLRKSVLILFLHFIISVRSAKLEEVSDYGAFTFSRDQFRLIYHAKAFAQYGYPKLFYATATACPVESSQEQVFNDQHSLGKNSLFVRDTYESSQSSIDIAYQICKTPYKMSVIYQRVAVEFQFGFEIYYDKSKFRGKTFVDSKRWIYDLITNTHSTQNHVMSVLSRTPSMPVTLRHLVLTPVTSVVSKIPQYPKIYLDKKTDLGFVWVLAFYSKFNFRLKRVAQVVYNLIPAAEGEYKCTDWNLGIEYFTGIGIAIDDLYSKGNQEKMLKGVEIPTSKPHVENEENEDAACKSANQCFAKWSTIPEQQLHFLAPEFISCSYLLAVPIWKSTIEGVLKKLDNFLHTTFRVMGEPIGAIRIHSGVHGDLQLPTNSGTTQSLKTITLAENDIPVPDIIYKIIKHKRTICKRENIKTDEPKQGDENNELKESSDQHKPKNDEKIEDPKDEPKESSEKDKPKDDDKKNKLKKEDNENDVLGGDDHGYELVEEIESDESESDETDELLEDRESEEPKKSNCISRETATIVVIHNNPNFNPETDKICDDMCKSWGWDEIQIREVAGRRFKSKYIYCCGPHDPNVRKKLGISNFENADVAPFALTFIFVPNFDRMDFQDVRDIRVTVVNEYKRLFERGEPQPTEIEKTTGEFFKIPKPKHGKDEPEKSETELVNDEIVLEDSPQENQVK